MFICVLRKSYIFNAVWWIILGFIGSWVAKSFINLSYAPHSSIFIGVSVAIYYLLMAFGRLQVRDKGILVYADLIRWERIESFDWVYGNEKMYTLKFKLAGRSPSFLRNGALSIPVEKKNELEEILKYHLPNKAVTAKSA